MLPYTCTVGPQALTVGLGKMPILPARGGGVNFGLLLQISTYFFIFSTYMGNTKKYVKIHEGKKKYVGNTKE